MADREIMIPWGLFDQAYEKACNVQNLAVYPEAKYHLPPPVKAIDLLGMRLFVWGASFHGVNRRMHGLVISPAIGHEHHLPSVMSHYGKHLGPKQDLNTLVKVNGIPHVIRERVELKSDYPVPAKALGLDDARAHLAVGSNFGMWWHMLKQKGAAQDLVQHGLFVIANFLMPESSSEPDSRYLLWRRGKYIEHHFIPDGVELPAAPTTQFDQYGQLSLF